MRTISCIVVDDEPLAVQLIETYLKKTPFLRLEGSFTSGSAAYSFLQENAVDLIFCDIQMPNLSGMELSKMLPGNTRIIFTTAFSNYAVEGFKVRALDYLLKPISYDDFLKAANNAKEYFEMMEKGSSATPPSDAGVKSIFVKSEYKLQQIILDNIAFVEGLKDYVKIHLCDGSDPVLSLMRMKTMEDQLPSSRFVRVHRSYIVQVSKIGSIERSHIIIGKNRIPIGDTYQDSLLTTLSSGSLMP